MKSFDKKIIVASLFLLLLLGGLWLWEKSHNLISFSSGTVFYLSTEKDKNGQLMAFDPVRKETYSLNRDPHIVNQFLLYQSNKKKHIFYLSVPKEKFSDAYSINQHQDLYILDLETGKKRKVKKPSNIKFSKMYPKIVNDKIFFETPDNIWYYSLRQKQWGEMYKQIPLQDIGLSENAQLLVGANPLENFGFTLLPLIEDESQSSPIGNYFQNFGFSPDGRNILLRQKPDQDIFSNQSYLIIFRADGTAQEILKDKGDIPQALWRDNETLLVVLRDENFMEKILLINLFDPDNPIEILENGSIQWINFKNNKLWIVTEEETIEGADYNEKEGIQGLLDAFADIPKEYHIWIYDLESNELSTSPIQGFFPRTF